MNGPLRGIAIPLAAIVTLAVSPRAQAVQNWFGYGGVFGSQTQYTFYAPQQVTAGYAPQAVTSFSVPAGLGQQVIVSSSPVVVPAVSYSPVTTLAPVTSCRPVVTYSPACGTVCGAPTLIAPPAATAPVIVTPPAATVVPSTPTYGTPTYPPPGVYTPGTTIPFPPAASPEMPTSSTTVSPADQPPTLSGFAPLSTATTPLAPASVAPPQGAGVAPPAAPSGATPEKSDASQPPVIDRLRPDLDISVPEEDETMTPVVPSDSESKSGKKSEAAPTGEKETGPRLDLDEDHTASRNKRPASLLAPATWRAARPAARRQGTTATSNGWRPVTK